MKLTNLKSGDNVTVYLRGNHNFTGTVKTVDSDESKLTLEANAGRVNTSGGEIEIDGAAIVAYSKK